MAFILLVTSADLAAAPATTEFTVKPHHGRPTLHVDGKPAYPFMYLPHGGDHRKQYRQFASTGAHFYSFACGIGNGKPGRFDAGAVDRAIQAVLDADPKGYLLLRISVTPPKWWLEANPDERVVFDNGEKGLQSFASTKWRKEIGDQLEAFVKHVRSKPYGNRVIGFHLCTGVTAEWQSWGLWSDRRGDFGRVALGAWLAWLRSRYPNDQALQTAWGRSDVTLDTATLPSRDRREGKSPRFLRRPDDYQDVIDFYRFWPNLVADSIVELAARCKSACDRKALVGVFYGYAAQYGGKAQESQHLALSNVLDCPDVDFLCSPAMYTDRGPGGTSTFMSATGSVNLQGKLWFDEADNRTHLVKPGGPFAHVYPAKTLAESRGVLQREFGHCVQRAAQLWWFDMGGGWYDDPAILKDFAEMKRLAPRLILDEIDLLPPPRIMAVHGYRAYPREQPEHPFLGEAVCKQIVSLSRVGSPSELYLLGDLGGAPDAKVYLFINCADLTESDRANINALKRDGNVLIFTYAAGLGRVDRRMNVSEDITAVSRLLGIRMELSEEPLRPRAAFVEQHALQNEPNLPVEFGYNQPVAPSFRCVDPNVQILARYTDADRPAVVMKVFDNHTVIWSAAAPIPPALLRAVARQTGLHVYSDADDALYAGRNLITLHAREPGLKTITLPDDVQAEPLYGAAPPKRSGRTLSFRMRRGETRAFRIK